MFIDERDDEIALIVWNYFKAVETRWRDYWTEVQPGFLLNRTTGFVGLMLFLPYAYNNLRPTGEVPSVEAFKSILDRATLDPSRVTRQNYPPGSAGQTQLMRELQAQTGLQ